MILRYIGEDEEQALGEGHLCHGLLAGLGPSSRRRTLRRWREEGAALPPDLAEEAAAAAAALAAMAAGPGSGAMAAGPGSGAAQPASEGGSPPPEEGPGPSGGPASSGGRQQQRGLHGQLWHGQRVVEAAMAAGGDAAVDELCARFRRGFVAALQPRHLPPGWQVEHAAPREFGAHSVYSAARGAAAADQLGGLQEE